MQKLVLYLFLVISASNSANSTVQDLGWAVQLYQFHGKIESKPFSLVSGDGEYKLFNINNSTVEAVEDGALCFHPFKIIRLENNKAIPKITKKMFGDCASLESLKINQTAKWKFENDAFSKLGSGKFDLILSGADVSELTKDTVKFPSTLHKVYVSDSAITRVDLSVFDRLESLQTISLKSNGITEIVGEFCEELTRVETLDLSHNPLTKEFPWRLLKNLVNLKNIRLNHTGVENYDADTIAANVPELTELNLGHAGAEICKLQGKLKNELETKLGNGRRVHVYCGGRNLW